MPAPARAAARAASIGAPVIPVEPPNTSSAGRPLVALASAHRKREIDDARAHASSRHTPTSMPMSTTCTCPARDGRARTTARASTPRSRPSRSARTASPANRAGRAVDARRDVDRERRGPIAELRARHVPRQPSSAPRNPVPNIASTNRSARAQRAVRSSVDSAGEVERVDSDTTRAAAAPQRRDRRRRCCPCRTRRRPGARTSRRASARRAPRPPGRRARPAPLPACPPRSRAGRLSPSPSGVRTGRIGPCAPPAPVSRADATRCVAGPPAVGESDDRARSAGRRGRSCRARRRASTGSTSVTWSAMAS